MGRQRYKPIRERRELVLNLAGLGIPHDKIAMLVKCSPKTLRKHFHGELARGSTEANAQVAGFLFQSAKNGNVAAQIFWLKSRGGWKESPHNAPEVFDPVAEQATEDELIGKIIGLVQRRQEANRFEAEAAEKMKQVWGHEKKKPSRKRQKKPMSPLLLTRR